MLSLMVVMLVIVSKRALLALNEDDGHDNVDVDAGDVDGTEQEGTFGSQR